MAPSDLSNFLAGEEPPPEGQPGGDQPDAGAPPTEAPAAEASPPPPPAPVDGISTLAGRFEIQTRNRIGGMDTVAAEAYVAVGAKSASGSYFAYVMKSLLPARTDVLRTLREIDHPALMRPVDFGVINWPETGSKRLAIVYERPAGTRLFQALRGQRAPMSEDQVAKGVIRPTLHALKEMKNHRLFHGAINPINMFLHDVGGAAIQIGDCATGPVGYNQPAIFETVERGMAVRSGRGIGTIADDLYSLGVTIVFLLLGRNPLIDLDVKEMLQLKIDKGSFAALASDSKLSLAMMEPIRGLLMDDAAQRWTLEDLDLWLSGRRLSPKQGQPAKRAHRPLDFEGQGYYTPRALALGLAANPRAANEVISSGELEVWVRRRLEADEIADKLLEAVTSSSPGANFEDRRLARALVALDPRAPLRFRGVSAMPDGIGGALAEAFVEERSNTAITALAEIIGDRLPMFWAGAQVEFKADYVTTTKTFDSMNTLMNRQTWGYGIERCLYELNPTLACLSPSLRDEYIVELEDFMHHMESVAGKSTRPSEPVDRHIAAFVKARYNGMQESILAALGGNADPVVKIQALVEFYFELQKHTKVVPQPKLCAWVAEQFEPIIAQYNSRTLRERMTKEVKKEAATGLFKNLIPLARNPDLVRRDRMAFETAKRDFGKAKQDLALVKKRMDFKMEISQLVGRQYAAMVASVLSALLLMAIILSRI